MSVRVGPTPHPTAARYSARNVDEVYRFIESIERWLAAPPLLAGAAADRRHR